MTLYTLESPHSVGRIPGMGVLAVDTSYLIALSDRNHVFNSPVTAFHTAAQGAGVTFVYNSVVRQEFMKWVRAGLLIQAIIRALAADVRLETRYRAISNITRAPLDATTLEFKYEAIYKDHLRANDVQILLNALPAQIGNEVKRLESTSGMLYWAVEDWLDWDEIETIIRLRGMAPSDAQIARFTVYIQANGIVTADKDYVALESILDIYMPQAVATPCAAYDAARDHRPQP